MQSKILHNCIAIILTASFLLSCINVNVGKVCAAEGISDDMKNLSLCYAEETVSGNISFTTSDLSSKGIPDRSRAYKTSHEGGLDTATYIVYNTQKEFSSVYLEAAYLKKNDRIGRDMLFETSYDGITYIPFEKIKKTVDEENWANNCWRVVTFKSVGELPYGTKYVRIAFGSTAEIGAGGNTAVQISSISLNIREKETDVKQLLKNMLDDARVLYQNANVGSDFGMYSQKDYSAFADAVELAEEAYNNQTGTESELYNSVNQLSAAISEFEKAVITEAIIHDECEKTSFPYMTSGDVSVATSAYEKFNGDNSRYYKKVNHAGEYVIYSIGNENKVKNVAVDAWYYKINQKVGADCSVEWSNNGTDFYKLNATKEINNSEWADGEWRMITFTLSDIPETTKYIKVVIGDTTATGLLYAVQIGSVTIKLSRDYSVLLQNKLTEAAELLSTVPAGNEPGMCPTAIIGELLSAKSTAENLPETAAEDIELKASIEALNDAINQVKNSIIYAIKWVDGAVLSAVGTGSTEITLSWQHATGSGAINYEVYQGDRLIGKTDTTSYRITNLLPGILYSLHVIAVSKSGNSLPLAATKARTADAKIFNSPDAELISPDDFNDEDYLAPLIWKNDTRGIPYYYFNLYKILNAVKMEEPNRGFVDIFVSRKYSAFTPLNVRIQEAQLPITYFYTRNESWNEYYNNPEVKIRLEAVLQHILDLQKTESNPSKGEYAGAWPQSTTNTYDLAGTTFTLNFLGQSLKLLHEAKKADPEFLSINGEMFQRINEACRKAIILTLTNQKWYDYGLDYSNQYGLIWSATAAYLEYNPDAEIEKLLKEKYQKSDEFISPAGFYYEQGGFDMSYNLGVHTNNISAEYSYFKGTDMEKKLIEDQSRFIDWLSYNMVVEPDGSCFSTNGAPSRRISTINYSIYRKDMPIAEKIPMARAFLRSDEDIEEEITRNKSATVKNGAWPVLPEMTLRGGDAYNAYGIFDKLMYEYVPTEAERWDAIESLPYMAREAFNHQRADEESGLEFTYIKRPNYYTIFNAGKKVSNMQVFGQGLLWHPEGGIMFASQSEDTDTTGEDNIPAANDFSWGTKDYTENRNQATVRVYENANLWGSNGGNAYQNLQYRVNGEQINPQTGIADLPEGNVEISYDLMRSGERKGRKEISYTDDGINVNVQHAGGLQECFPLMVRNEDKLEAEGNRIKLTRGRAVMEIVFNKPVKIKIGSRNYKMSRYQMHMLTAATLEDSLSYTISMIDELETDSEFISVTDFMLKDSDGKEIKRRNDLKQCKTINVSGKLTMDKPIENCVIATAVVDGDKLYGLSLIPITKSGAFQSDKEHSIIISDDIINPDIRLFIWNELTSCVPLTSAKSILNQ